ncbi:unnamed protein product, partial [Allacma fusca]
MAGIDKLRKRRAALKGQLTQYNTRISAIDANTVTRPEIDTIRKRVLQIQEKLEKNSEGIIDLLTDDAIIQAQIQDQDNIENTCADLEMRLSRREAKAIVREKEQDIARLTTTAQTQPTQP